MNADQDRDTFRRHVRESDRYAAEHDVERANAETAALTKVGAPWADADQLLELLSPLLDAAEPANVRFAAASYLFHAGHQAEAVPTLEDIQNSAGLEAVTARVLVDSWRSAGADGG
jgi:predicted aconitase